MPPARRFCLNGHDTDVVGRNNKRTCRACARQHRAKYHSTPKGRAVREKAIDRYIWSAKGMLNRIANERRRER